MTSRSVFPLLHMLDVMPGVFQDHLLPALDDRHKSVLAASCRALCKLVQQSVKHIQLLAGQCCRVQDDRLAKKMPNVTHLCLKPGNLHEAMFVLPIFFMQDARFMPGITSLQLLDHLPDSPPTKVQCGSCTAWTSTYDLSAILATAATCMPNLASLEFSTHYISDAECAAIAFMTGLTKLQLRSSHGTKTGGLARFTSLQHLADLGLNDSNLHCDPSDIAMLLGCSCLTRLQLGYYPALLPPLLHSLLELQETAALQAAGQAGSSTTAEAAAYRRQRLGSTGEVALAMVVEATTLGSTPPGSTTAPVGLPSPPPLKDLSIVLSPYMNFALNAFKAVVALTGLTRLNMGWFVRREHMLASESVAVVLPCEEQRALTQLVSLKQLGLGWTPSHEVLETVGYLTGITQLQLGGLPTGNPQPTLHLPSIQRLITHINVTPFPPLMGSAGYVDSLVIFQGLTCLELTGCVYAEVLAQLPRVAPKLQELLLPQRMHLLTWTDLANLQRLSALTSLRIGWKAALHEGPPSLDALPEEQSVEMLFNGGMQFVAQWVPDEAAQQQQEEAAVEQEAADAGSVTLGPELEETAVAEPKTRTVSLSALTERVPAVVPVTFPPATFAATVAAAGPSSSAGSVPTLQPAAAAAGPQQQCPVCNAEVQVGCLCKLVKLELVGPVSACELQHLTPLPNLRTVVLRDNCCWSSGLPCTDLAQFAAASSSLRRLELISCAGLSGSALERALQAASPERWTSVDITVRSGGKTSADLGLGYQYMGTLVTPAEERGEPEQVWWGGAAEEVQPGFGVGAALIGPQLPPVELPPLPHLHMPSIELYYQQQHVQQQLMQQLLQHQQHMQQLQQHLGGP